MTFRIQGGRGYGLVRAEDGDAAAPAATLWLYDMIGWDFFGEGITAKKVVEDLAALGKISALDVRINSPGGDVFDGITIYNALARFDAQVTVHVDGLAASIASLIAMAGERTLVAENAMFMVHRPWTLAVGDGGELRRVADLLDKAWSSMLTTYARRTGRRAETLEQKVANAGGEWWMTADEAVSESFADATEAAEEEAKAFGLQRFQRVPARLAASTGGGAGPPLPRAPSVAEIVTPTAVRPANAGDRAGARRRRIVDALHRATC